MVSRCSPVLVLIVFTWGVSMAGNYADEVDPFIGVKGEGACMPGPCIPHGSVYPSPNTHQCDNGGYDFSRDIVGFAQLHTQGTGGAPSYGNILVSPRTWFALGETQHASGKANEVARCYSYGVMLTKFGIRCDVTPTHHCALYRFRFPAGDSAHVMIDLTRKVGGAAAIRRGNITVDRAKGTIEGTVRLGDNWCAGDFDLHFCAQFSVPPAEMGTWEGTAVNRGATRTESTTKGVALGAFAQFSTNENAAVLLKIAVSFRSVEQARLWLAAEVPGFDFESTEAQARSLWDKALSTIDIDGASQQERTKFYTAMFHAMVQPRDRTADFARYGDAVMWDDHYTKWDTRRSQFPLMCLIDPEMVSGVVNSFLVRQRVLPPASDRLPIHPKVETAFTQGQECRRGQGGDEVDNIIADAYVKGIPGVDWRAAYALMKYNATYGRSMGYIDNGYFYVNEPYGDWRAQSGSCTPNFAYNDYCVATVAGGLGEAQDADTWLKRSQQWRNVWNPSAVSDNFRGFIGPRRQDGSFQTIDLKANQSRNGYYEGSAWIYSFFVPHDMPSLIDSMGGNQAFVDRLKHALTKGYIDFTNEPSFLTPRLFNYAGRPDLSSYWVRKYSSLFTNTGYPGDEDAGAMSSAFVFAAAGLFPNAGQPLYLLNGPSYPLVSFNLPGGQAFKIVGVNAGPQNIYVQSATLNGVTLDRCWITHQEIIDGGELRFEMGPIPSTWAHNGPLPPTKHQAPVRGGAAVSRKVESQPTITWANNAEKTLWVRGDGLRSLTIHTIDGKQIGVHRLRKESGQHKVNLGQVASGAYLATIEGATSRSTRRLLVP